MLKAARIRTHAILHSMKPLGSGPTSRPRLEMMELDAALPPNYEWYADQVGGHHPSVIKNGMRQIGILKERGKRTLLKLVQDGIRGDNEICLYEMVPSSSKTEEVSDADGLFKRLGPMLPTYFGRRRIQIGENGYEFIELEDVTEPFSMPCVMDIKIGKVTYDPMASEKKKETENAKCPFQEAFGFRILGYRMHTDVLREPRVRDKTWGKTRTMENVQQAFEEYLEGRPKDALAVVTAFLERLDLMRDWFNEQELLHFYASSLLFVYEGDSRHPLRVDVRMIDFSHVFRVESGKDENYLHGLNFICNSFNRIHRDMLSLPN